MAEGLETEPSTATQQSQQEGAADQEEEEDQDWRIGGREVQTEEGEQRQEVETGQEDRRTGGEQEQGDDDAAVATARKVIRHNCLQCPPGAARLIGLCHHIWMSSTAFCVTVNATAATYAVVHTCLHSHCPHSLLPWQSLDCFLALLARFGTACSIHVPFLLVQPLL